MSNQLPLHHAPFGRNISARLHYFRILLILTFYLSYYIHFIIYLHINLYHNVIFSMTLFLYRSLSTSYFFGTIINKTNSKAVNKRCDFTPQFFRQTYQTYRAVIICRYAMYIRIYEICFIIICDLSPLTHMHFSLSTLDINTMFSNTCCKITFRLHLEE